MYGSCCAVHLDLVPVTFEITTGPIFDAGTSRYSLYVFGESGMYSVSIGIIANVVDVASAGSVDEAYGEVGVGASVG